LHKKKWSKIVREKLDVNRPLVPEASSN